MPAQRIAEAEEPPVGLIAGGGALPIQIASRLVASGRALYVVRLAGIADAALSGFKGAEAGLGETGRHIQLLKAAGCRQLCFAGLVKRPPLNELKLDARGLQAIPGAIAASRRGDDGLLRYVLSVYEREGFEIVGADSLNAELVLPPGSLGSLSPSTEQMEDVDKAMQIARAIGALDIGQAAVVVEGLVIAVEAQEGTDGVLRRCADLPTALRGHAAARRGVVAKAPKPIQERRVDLPTIGVGTVELAAAAGLAGLAGEAGGVLLVDRAAVTAAADRLGLFIYGAPPIKPA